MTLMAIILGLTAPFILGAGLWMRIRPPRRINYLMGYRTKRSMSSQEDWDFAQAHSATSLLKWGSVLGLVSVVALFLPSVPEMVEVSISVVLIVGLCVYHFVETERALKNRNRPSE